MWYKSSFVKARKKFHIHYFNITLLLQWFEFWRCKTNIHVFFFTLSLIFQRSPHPTLPQPWMWTPLLGGWECLTRTISPTLYPPPVGGALPCCLSMVSDTPSPLSSFWFFLGITPKWQSGNKLFLDQLFSLWHNAFTKWLNFSPFTLNFLKTDMMLFILYNLENQVMSDGEQMPEDVEHIPPPPSRWVTLGSSCTLDSIFIVQLYFILDLIK